MDFILLYKGIREAAKERSLFSGPASEALPPPNLDELSGPIYFMDNINLESQSNNIRHIKIVCDYMCTH